MISRDLLAELEPYIAQARRFSGWDLDVHEIPLEPGPPWSYEELVRSYGQRASAAIDLGTGGGEFLSRVRASLPPFVVATEEWQVNAPIARDRLSPLGIPVVHGSSLQLMFRDASFDLVLDRHEALNPAEVARVLRPGGTVVTQQMGRNLWQELRRYFPYMTDFGDLLHDYTDGFRRAGLGVSQRMEHDQRIAYPTLGELVYLMLLAPWQFPGFDPERELDALRAVERELGCEQGIALTMSHFLIVAHKPF